MKRNILACTVSSLESLKSLTGPISCWLHFDGTATIDLSLIVHKLLALDCCHFAVSGPNAVEVHDEIDDIVVGIENKLILTTWHAGDLREAAFDFLVTRCEGGVEALKLAIVISNDDRHALTKLSEIMNALSLVLE